MRGSRPWGLGLIVAMAAVPWLAPGATAGLGPVVTEFPVPTAGSGPEAITPAGVITEFPLPSASSSPAGITAGPDGNLWFTEATGDRIGRITPAGVITEFHMSPPLGRGPTGITAGPDGNLWFTETTGNMIGRITPAGGIKEFPSPRQPADPMASRPAPTAASTSPRPPATP
jgi:streptogramin lyase